MMTSPNEGAAVGRLNETLIARIASTVGAES
jgi:hypothetical protein